MKRRRDHRHGAVPLPSRRRLRELLRYDEETGLLYWRVARGPRRAGAPAGNAHPDGRRAVMVDRSMYLAARVAWKMKTGRDPLGVIDHWDQDNSNDRWWNLRDITVRENNLNRGLSRKNTSGFRGVHQVPSGRWRAEIKSRGKRVCLGTFDTAERAAEAYTWASLIHHTTRWFRFGGDFR